MPKERTNFFFLLRHKKFYFCQKSDPRFKKKNFFSVDVLKVLNKFDLNDKKKNNFLYAVFALTIQFL